MKKKELELHKQGYLPGDQETLPAFQKRIAKLQSFSKNPFLSLKEQNFTEPFSLKEKVPDHHWDWPKKTLEKNFDFSPFSNTAFFSDEKLFFWQGAQAWILEEKGIVMLQLRKKFKKGNFGIYSKEEILAHEAVHSFRASLKDSFFEEIFAYATSSSKFRRVFGPMLQNTKEVLLFLFPLLLLWGSLAFPILSSFSWLALGGVLGFFLFRLAYFRKIFRNAYKNLKEFFPKINPWFILVRLEGEEIQDLSGMTFEEFSNYSKKKISSSLRWQMIRDTYFT